MAGFTTIQSVGAPNDIPLRDAIAKGLIPGPRILTAVQPLEGQGDKTGTPDEIRAFVRKQKASGRGPDQNLRVEVHSAGWRHDAFAGAIERGL